MISIEITKSVKIRTLGSQSWTLRFQSRTLRSQSRTLRSQSWTLRSQSQALGSQSRQRRVGLRCSVALGHRCSVVRRTTTRI